MTDKKFPMVILAGGPTPEKIIEAGETESERAFLDINGKPMIQWVIDAINESGICDDLVCIGNADRLVNTCGFTPSQVLSQGSGMLENLMLGMKHFESAPLVIQMTCDIPLLTGEALQHLAGEVGKIDADIYYPIINVKHFDEKFDGTRRTTQKLKDGEFTGGNVFVLNPKVAIKSKTLIDKVIDARKSPLKLVQIMGLPFLLKFALKQLNIKGLEKKASEILAAEMRTIQSPYAGIGFDVDKPADLDVARAIFAGKS